MDCLADRIKSTVKAAHLNVRCLAALTKVHYGSIYHTIKKGDKAKPTTLVREAIEAALDKLDILVSGGELPLDKHLKQEEKVRAILELFSKYE